MKCTNKEAIASYRRVLRLVDRYIRKEKADLLITDGKGLMTWGEIRFHIKEVLGLKPQ